MYASSSIVTLLERGASPVIAAAGIDEARALHSRLPDYPVGFEEDVACARLDVSTVVPSLRRGEDESLTLLPFAASVAQNLAPAILLRVTIFTEHAPGTPVRPGSFPAPCS